MELATRGQRFLAQAVDMSTMSVLALLIGPGHGLVPKSVALVLAAALIVLLLAQMWLLWTRGQTIGKIALGIRIVRVDTQANGGFVTNLLVRTLLNNVLISLPLVGLLYGLADALFIFRNDRRCLHDLLAKTCVIVGQP